MNTESVRQLWDRAFSAGEDLALFAFETTDYFGDTDNETVELVASYAYCWHRGLVTEREYHDALTGRLGCGTAVFFDFQQMADRHMREGHNWAS